MTRRRGGSRCRSCDRPVKWFKSPYSSNWRLFEPEPVDPRTHVGAAAFPTEGARAWVLRELVEELMVRREQSRADAEDEAYAFPWYVLHTCPSEWLLADVTCTHHLADQVDGLLCTRLDAHDPDAAGGHVYKSTSGIPDCPKEEL